MKSKNEQRAVAALTAVDLFAGAGGLTASLEARGWQSVAAVDLDRDAAATLRLNQQSGHLVGTRIIEGDIKAVTARDLRPAGTTSAWRPTLLAGGPPCQPFSAAGLMRGLRDPRGQLFKEFVRLADELKPRFVLFENVAGLVTSKAGGRVGGTLALIQREFENIGYGCRFELLNAADFGAAQRRVRLYMIAARRDELPAFPAPTHARSGTLDRLPWVTLQAVLSGMPAPDSADIVRPKGRRADELAHLTPGTGLRTGGVVEANRPGGHWGYRQDCFLADPALPGRTIRAATTPDWIRDSVGLRRLTWRECAKLQGFPPSWQFVGSIASRFRQIGNAVQGDIGRALATTLIAAAARPVGRAAPASAPWPSSFQRRVRYTTNEEAVNGAHRRAARERTNAVAAASLV